MGEADVRVAAGVVVTALREAGRSEGTIRRYQAVLDRFAAFLAGRGLRTASDQACVDFIAGQTGTRLGALREPVADTDVQAVRRPVVLMADALAGRAVVIDRPVVPAKDGCPAGFRLLRDDYVASPRRVATPRRPWSRRARWSAGSPPHRHLRHESEPHLWTAEEIRRLLAVIVRPAGQATRSCPANRCGRLRGRNEAGILALWGAAG